MHGNEEDKEALQRGFQVGGGVEAIRGDLTLAELAMKHGIHHSMIAAWKRHA